MKRNGTVKDALRRKLFELAKDGAFAIRRIDIHEHYAVIYLEETNGMELFDKWEALPDDREYRSGWIETDEGAQKIFLEV